MVSVAGNCGAGVVGAIAREIENACRINDLSAAQTFIPPFEAALAEALGSLNALLAA